MGLIIKPVTLIIRPVRAKQHGNRRFSQLFHVNQVVTLLPCIVIIVNSAFSHDNYLLNMGYFTFGDKIGRSEKSLLMSSAVRFQNTCKIPMMVVKDVICLRKNNIYQIWLVKDGWSQAGKGFSVWRSKGGRRTAESIIISFNNNDL